MTFLTPIPNVVRMGCVIFAMTLTLALAARAQIDSSPAPAPSDTTTGEIPSTEAAPDTGTVAASTQPSSTPEEFAPFGVKLKVPPEWRRLPEGGANVIGRWALLKPDSSQQVSTIVTVEMEPAKSRTAEA